MRSVCTLQHFYVNSFELIPYHMIMANYILVDGVRLEPSRRMDLKSLRILLKGTTHARKPLSPIILATSKVVIYSYTYIDYATMHSCATLQANHVFLQNKGHLLYEISSRIGQCHNLHHRNRFTASCLSTLTLYQKTYLQFSQTLKNILNVCSLIHPRITLELVLQPKTWVTPSRAFSLIESMAEA